MKGTTNKKKPVILEPQWIKIQLKEQKEIQLLETIKKLTKEKTASKAVYEALENYPNVCKRADGLNTELQKVNRDYEQLLMKFGTVQRAFKIINDADKLSDEIRGIGINYKEKNLEINEVCPDCGCSDENFFMNVCSECGYNYKHDEAAI